MRPVCRQKIEEDLCQMCWRCTASTGTSTCGKSNPLLRTYIGLTATIITLQDSEELQDVQEEVHNCEEERDRQTDRVWQCIGHIFRAFYIIQDIALENG